MKISFRNGTIILGIVILGWVVVALIKFTISSPDRNWGVMKEPIARPGSVTNVNVTLGKSGGEAATSTEFEPIGPTKSKQRPIETALDKKRRERQRLVQTLERYKNAGLGESHPARVKATEDLKKTEDELAALGDKPMD